MLKRIFVTIAVIATSISAMAAEYAYPEQYKISYTIDSFTGPGDRIYYNCDSVESNTKSLLKKLGAEKIRVTCSGGFDPYTGFPPTPAYVTAKFIAPTMTKNNATPRLASVKEIELRGSDDCHFMKSTLEGLAEEIELNIVDGPNFCSSGRAPSSRFTVEVLSFD